MTTSSPEHRDRRKLFWILFVLFLLDTLITAWAIARGSAEANPLYWAFHDAHKGWQEIADAVGVRITLGLAVFYLLYRQATERILRLVVVGYATVIAMMTSLHALTSLPPNVRYIAILLIRFIASAYLVVLGIAGVMIVWLFLTNRRLLPFMEKRSD